MPLARHYTDPDLAAIYDVENAGLDAAGFYLALAAEFGAQRVADLGCGTGALACELAERGHEVTGVDPAPAMLEVARTRPGAACVRWVEGTAAQLEADAFDLVVMTGHAAQEIVDDAAWREGLRHLHHALSPGGRLAFESRNPGAAPWRRWNRGASFIAYPARDGTPAFDSWVETVSVGDGVVTFVGHRRFQPSGREELIESTLRFRSLDELEGGLRAAGFVTRSLFGNWDRSAFDDDSPEIILVAERR